MFMCFVADNFNIPSFCGIFVSRLTTSIETRNVRLFTFVFSVKGMVFGILILVVAVYQQIFFKHTTTFYQIIKRKPNIHVVTRGWFMQFPTLLQGWVSHFCAEGGGARWAMCFLSTTFPNALAHYTPPPPSPILFDQSLTTV